MTYLYTDGDLFPAHAGVIPRSNNCGYGEGSFPRTRGGDPGTAATWYTGSNFSPHTRG